MSQIVENYAKRFGFKTKSMFGELIPACPKCDGTSLETGYRVGRGGRGWALYCKSCRHVGYAKKVTKGRYKR